MFGGAKRIMQFVINTARRQLFQLRDEWGDAYAASYQDVALAALSQGKQILWFGDVDVVAHLHGIVHVHRAAFAIHIFAHTDLVFGQLGGRTHEGIGIRQLVAHLHDDVAAARKCGKVAAIGFLKRELFD